MQLTNRATDVALYVLWLAQEAGDSTLTNLKLLKLIYYGLMVLFNLFNFILCNYYVV